MQVLINGRFLSRPVTGVERYALDVSALILRNHPEAAFIVPEHSVNVPTKRTIKSGTGHGHFWEQTTLARESRNADLLINLANTGPLMGGKQIVAIHDLAFWHHPEWFKKGFARAYKELIPRLLRQAAHVITVSNASKQDIVRSLIVDPSKISIVPPYTMFHGEHDRPSKVDRPYFLMVGTQDRRKNFGPAIRAFQQIVRSNTELIIVGRKMKHLRADVSQSGADSNIRFLEHVNDEQLEDLYKGATALVCTSLFEGFGLPILEAMACGTPVIASDIHVFREQFGDAPFYVDPQNSEQIGYAMTRFIKQPDVARFHARKGRVVAAGYTAANTWEKLKPILDLQLQHA